MKRITQRDIEAYRKRMKANRKTNKHFYKKAVVIRTKVINEPPFKEQYDTFLKSSYWKKRRQKILTEQGAACAICSSLEDLHVHHISYEHLFNPKSGEVVILCRNHHMEFHSQYPIKNNMFIEWADFKVHYNNII